MPRKPNGTRRCNHCCQVLPESANQGTRYCDPCVSRRRRCTLCRKYFFQASSDQARCEECRSLPVSLTASDMDSTSVKAVSRLTDERLKVFQERAAQGLPLFD